MHKFRQYAAQPETHHQRAFPRFEMDVTGTGLDGVVEEIIDEQPNFDPAFRGFRLKISNGLAHKLWRFAFSKVAAPEMSLPNSNYGRHQNRAGPSDPKNSKYLLRAPKPLINIT